MHEVERVLSEDSLRELMLTMVSAHDHAAELSDSAFADSLGPDFLSASLGPTSAVFQGQHQEEYTTQQRQQKREGYAM